jgi:Cdc6-like AAA superfamily ATPase
MLKVFEEGAVEYAARKVSAISGDARRALEVCRSAKQLFLSHKIHIK